MAYFDYSLPDTIDLTPGMRELGDALTDALSRRQRQRQFDETMRLKKAHEDRLFEQHQNQLGYQNRVTDEKLKRERLEFNQRQNEYKGRQQQRIRQARSPQEAAAIASETVIYDPATGQEVGRGELVPGQAPDAGPAPAVPPRPQAPEEGFGPAPPPEIMARRRGLQKPEPAPDALIGPIPSAEEASAAEAQRFFDEPGGQMADLEPRLAQVEQERQAQLIARRKFDEQYRAFRQEAEQATQDEQARLDTNFQAADDFQRDSAAFSEAERTFPARQAEHAAATRRAEDARPYTVRFGQDDPGTTFDFQTQRTAGRQQAAQDFLDNLPPGLNENDRQAAQIGHSLILAGHDSRRVFDAFTKARTLGLEHAFKDMQGDKRDRNRLEVQELRNQAPRPNINLPGARFEFERDKEKSKILREDLKRFTERYNAKTIQDDHLAAPRIIGDLQSGNPQRQRNAMIELWRMAQHDNRMSDRDAIMAQTVDPSALAEIENWVSRKSTGSLDAGVQRTAIETAQAFAAHLAAKTKQMRELAKRDFIDSGLYDSTEADVLLSQQIPGWEPLRGAPAPGAPPEVNAAREAKKRAAKKKAREKSPPGKTAGGASTDELLDNL